MTWRIEIGTGTDRVLLGEILTAQSAWKLLSKPARAAVEAAYPDRPVAAHPLTLAALKAHGFIERGYHTDYADRLTEAGKAVARWNVEAKP